MNFKQVKKLIWYVILGAVLSYGGCNFQDLDVKDLENPTLEGEVAIPLGYVSYTLRELIDRAGTDIEYEEDPDTKLFFFSYYDTITFDSGEDIVDVGSVYETRNINMPPTPALPVASTLTIQDTFLISYPLERDEELHVVYYQDPGGGTASLEITPSFSFQNISYTCVLTDTRRVSDDQQMVFTANGSQDLSGYYTRLQSGETPGSQVFTMIITIDIEVASGVELTSSDQIEVNLQFDNQAFSRIDGKFREKTVDLGNQSISLPFFEELGNSGFELRNPSLTFTFLNSFGVPLALDLGGVYGLKSGDSTFLSGAIVENESLWPRIPAATSETAIGTGTTVIDNSNSQLRALLATSPDEVGFPIRATTNLDDPEADNFILNTSSITAYVEARLPLEVSLDSVSRDLTFSLGSGLNFNEADSLTLRITSTNWLPVNVLFDVDILDELDTVLYNVDRNLALLSGRLNAADSVIRPGVALENVPLSPEGIEALNQGRNIRLRLILVTPPSITSNDIYVKLYGDQFFDLQLSVVGTLNTDL